MSDEIMAKILDAEDGVSVNLDGVNVPEILEFLKEKLAIVAKHKLECFQDLRKTMGRTPRVQQDLDDAHERYYEACRDSEEVQANMSRVRRGDAARSKAAAIQAQGSDEVVTNGLT